MTRPHFLADEDLRFEIVSAVRRLEPVLDISTVQELGRDGLSDGEQLEFAQQEGYILVSHDVNTLRGLARRTGSRRSTAQSNSPREVAEPIVLLWDASDASEWIDRVVFIPF